MTNHFRHVNILKGEVYYRALFRENKSGADAPPVVVRALLLYVRRRIVYTIFGLNLLLTYAQEQFDQTSLWWNVTLLSYTTKYYTGVESMQGIYCVFPPHFPQNVDNRLIE